MKKTFFIYFLILCGFCGCGYTTSSLIYPERKIIIVPIVNKVDMTSEGKRFSGYTNYPVLMEKDLTNALIAKFNSDGNLDVVSNEIGALKITCTITNYTKEALRYTNTEDVQEQRLKLTVSTVLVDSTGTTVKTTDIVGQVDYYLTGPDMRTEKAAWIDLVKDAARRIVEFVVEQW